MARKESNKNTQVVSFPELFQFTVTEMFSPKSAKSLIDYDSLKLINLKDFALLNKSQIRFFVEYIGAFFITINLSALAMLFLVDFNSVPAEIPNVLGTSSNAEVIKGESVARDSCSFSINEVRYPSQSVVVVNRSNLKSLCVNHSIENGSALWQVNMNDGENLVMKGDCVNFENPSSVKSVETYIIGSSNIKSASCELGFSK